MTDGDIKEKYSTLDRMEYLRQGGKLKCPFCHEGIFSMVRPGVFQCDKCHRGVIGRPRHGILGVAKNNIESELKRSEKYEIINGRVCFVTRTNGYLRLDTISGKKDCIVIEFAEDKEEALNNRFEDGDTFAFTDAERIIQVMREELRND